MTSPSSLLTHRLIALLLGKSPHKPIDFAAPMRGGYSAGLDATTPIIFTPPHVRQSVGKPARFLALAISSAALSVLVIAMQLQPSTTGVGTHQQMGFQSCEFLRVTRLPCPTCGATTSVAWFVRGNWFRSLYVQPLGFVVGLTCGLMFWAGLFVALTGAPIHRLLNPLPAVWIVIGLMGIGIAAWGWKIFIHLARMDG